MMKFIFPLCLAIAFFVSPVFSQTTGYATPTYSKGGKLIALTDIQGLSDCSTKTVSGRVKKSQREKGSSIVRFRLGPRGGPIVELDTNRLGETERRVVFLQMVRARYYLRVAAYACTPDGPLSPFSMYRENDPDL